jgi:predicted RNase H-like nuclease (RuvC/YqgF family)
VELWWGAVEIMSEMLRWMWLLGRWRKSSDQEGYEPLLEQTQLEHRRLDLETRIEEYESDVRALKDNHVMLEDGEKKDAIFSEICSLDSQIFQLKSELATVNSLLSAYD